MLLVAIALLVAGCRPQDEIARYSVPKPELIDPTLVKAAADERQMLGAIVLVDKAGWFFKLTGAKAQVSPLAEPFITFVKDVKFAGTPAEPKWKVPAGWTELPGNEFRFATLEIPAGNKKLELTVSTLELGDVSEQDYVLANVNRWRGQLGLGVLSASELASATSQFRVGDHACMFIDITGVSTGPMFSHGIGAKDSVPADRPLNSSAVLATVSTPTFVKPMNWTEAELNSMRKAAFRVMEGDKEVLVTLIALPPSPRLANLRRWAEEVGRSTTRDEDLLKVTKRIDVCGIECDYCELTGQSEDKRAQMILGVIIPRGDVYWFAKLKGDSDLAGREQVNFESFVRSLRFE